MDPISSTSHKAVSSSSPPLVILDASDEEGLEGDSNSTTSSGASETEFPNEQSESEHLIMESISSSPVNKLASSPFLGGNGGSGGEEPQLLHAATANSRANFSQFETPADETRNNFGPDDFDEQLFIGQLGTNCTGTRRFEDEELEPQVIMDTADHSESSDVEDLFPNSSPDKLLPSLQSGAKTYKDRATTTEDIDESSSSGFPRSPLSHQNSNSRLRHHHHHRNSRFGGPSAGKRKASRGQRHDPNPLLLEKQVGSPQLAGLLLHKEEEQFQQGPDMEHLSEDLSCDNALDTESIEDHPHHDNHHHHHHIPICLNFTTPAEEEQLGEEQSTSRSCVLSSSDGLKSSPMRKRKGEMTADSPDESLPLKKPITDDDIDEFGLKVDYPEEDQQMDSPADEEDCGIIEGEEEEEVYEEEGPSSPYSCNNEEEGESSVVGEACSSSSVPCGSSSSGIRSIIPSKAHPPPRLGEWLHTFSGWSHPERLMAITELIATCEATQVRHMMQIIEPQFQRDFISLLPKELALYVLSFLYPRDLLRAAQTCKYWRILADDNLLWREKCKEAGIGYFSAMSNRVHRRSRTNATGHNSTATSSDVPNTRWKAAFMKQHYVEMNWKRKDTREHKILKGHDDHVITCLQFSGNRIVSGSDDNTLKVWSANTGKCLRTLLGHTGGVWSSQMSGTTIVSGSTDRTLRVWNAETGQCLHTLYGHTSTVRCMHLHGKKVVSGSRDATLRMWDVESGECLHVLVGHMAAVRCVQYNGHLVVSGAYDYMVRIWDPEREECLHQLSGHTNRVYSLQFDGIHVVSGSLDTSIRVWDVETGACKHTLMGHQSLTSGMELRDNLLVSGNADSTVKIWDISTGQCLLTLTGTNKHLSAVTCLQLINKFVITSSDDGTVKLWDIRSGEFVRNLVSLSSGGSGGVVWRIRASETKLVCAVGSRNGTEETKLLVLDFDSDPLKTEPKAEVKTEIQLDY